MSLGRGLLIVLEGLDGAGTTTQTRRLGAALGAAGRAVHTTREPSDGPIGKLLRAILAGAHAPVDQTTLSLLFAADRADHLQREVEPALAAGTLVISDRWYHSSLAYQGTGEERHWIAELNRRARRPDLTLYLDVDPDEAARRRQGDERNPEIFDQLATQRRVAAGYRAVIEMLRESERIEVVPGGASTDEVAEDVLARVTRVIASAERGI
ncbi:dTMP kinase [Haliangium sp.]|uniref:dTMP kinase n=1 Tax=Haliangium sp. TaxID=2663208 RepID=UPI003D13B70D